MDLQSNSQEYAYIDFSIAPPQGATVDASVDLINWRTVTFTNGEGIVLLRGPNCVQTTGLLVSADGPLYVRVTNLPEVVIRSAGVVNLY